MSLRVAQLLRAAVAHAQGALPQLAPGTAGGLPCSPMSLQLRTLANLSFQEKKRRALAASGQLGGPQAGLQPQTAVDNAPTVQPSETKASSLQVQQALNHPALIVTRPIEWGTVIFGYEQANRYQVFDQDGQPVAQIAEEYQGFGNEIGRQLLRTRRSFCSTVFSADGSQVIFRLRRPAYLLNSTMYIEDGEGSTMGEVRQRWHLFKRNYDIYINKQQFASISGTFLAWEFELKNAEGGTLALIDRNFQGFGRELFTDAGKYAIHFGQNERHIPQSQMDSISGAASTAQQALGGAAPTQAGQLPAASSAAQQQQQQPQAGSASSVMPMAQSTTDVSTIPTASGNELVVARPLQLEERMAVLAAAISIDYDYFSHHSHSTGFFPMWPMMMPFPGGGGTPTEAGREAGDVGEAGGGGAGGVGGAGAAGAAGEATGPSSAWQAPESQRGGLESELGNDDAFPSGEDFDKGGGEEMQWDLPQSGEGAEGGGGSGILGTLWDLLGGGD